MSIKNILVTFYETTAIPVAVINKTGTLSYAMPKTEAGSFFFPEHLRRCIHQFHYYHRDEYHPVIEILASYYYLGIAKLNEDQYVLLGPISPFSHSQERTLEFCKDVICPDKLISFCEIMNHTPITSYKKFINSFSLLIYLLSCLEVSPEHITLCNNFSAIKNTEQIFNEQLFRQRENMETHTSLDYENNVLQAIEIGNVTLLKERLSSPVIGRIGQMSQTLIMQERYTFVSFITMVTRAAIRGGLSTEEAFCLSDIYCNQMDSVTKIQDIAALTVKMAVDFCKHVHAKNSGKQFSPPVEKCCNYISQYLHETISLDQLAKITCLCSRVISKKFRAETGLSIPQYIHWEKMKEAKHLLKYSQHSINNIASYLQYPSQSYFTKIFFSFYQMTPLEYRNSPKIKEKEGIICLPSQ